jgi:hypothetical protein
MPKKLTLGAEYHPQEAKKLLTIFNANIYGDILWHR